MSVGLSVVIITATSSVVIAQAPTLALEGAGGISWDLVQSVIAKNLSVIIAGVALFIAFFQAHIMRKHNRLSVKPFLTISQMIIYGNRFPEVYFELRNVGVGPAILKHYTVFFDDTEFDLNFSEPGKAFRKHLFSVFYNPSVFWFGKERPMAVGESHKIIKGYVPVPGTDADTLAKRFGFKIEYQSIYQNETFLLEIPNSKGYPKNPSRNPKIKKD